MFSVNFRVIPGHTQSIWNHFFRTFLSLTSVRIQLKYQHAASDFWNFIIFSHMMPLPSGRYRTSSTKKNCSLNKRTWRITSSQSFPPQGSGFRNGHCLFFNKVITAFPIYPNPLLQGSFTTLVGALLLYLISCRGFSIPKDDGLYWYIQSK